MNNRTNIILETIKQLSEEEYSELMGAVVTWRGEKRETAVITPKKTIEETFNIKIPEDVIGVEVGTGAIVRKSGEE